MAENNPSRIVTPPGRLSFPALFEPRAVNEGDKPQFAATLLYPDGTDLTELKRIVGEAAVAKWGSDAINLLRTGAIRSPFRDCGEKAHLSGYEPGWTFVTLRSNSAPGVVDQAVKPITPLEQDRIRAGFWVQCSTHAYAWSHPQGGKGVSLSLNNIMLVKEDSPFDGRRAASEDFTPLQADTSGAADIDAGSAGDLIDF